MHIRIDNGQRRCKESIADAALVTHMPASNGKIRLFRCQLNTRHLDNDLQPFLLEFLRKSNVLAWLIKIRTILEWIWL